MPARSDVSRDRKVETPVTTETWIRWQTAYATFRGRRRGSHQEDFVSYLLDLEQRARSGLMPSMDLSRVNSSR